MSQQSSKSTYEHSIGYPDPKVMKYVWRSKSQNTESEAKPWRIRLFQERSEDRGIMHCEIVTKRSIYVLLHFSIFDQRWSEN